ncbi:hypothetical protein, partial [Tepidiforma sp.]|uniref:hypothetical protein n=1 Tax=Tepidiforma sp. TaxID=2682230 RepID=UPI002ADDAA21
MSHDAVSVARDAEALESAMPVRVQARRAAVRPRPLGGRRQRTALQFGGQVPRPALVGLAALSFALPFVLWTLLAA